MARKAKVRAKQAETRRQSIHRRWAEQHPELARQERALRLEQMHLVPDWGHKRGGTPETLEKASRVRQGALARLFMSGALSADQLAWAAEIRTVADRIGRDVTIGTMSMETRVDQSRSGSGAFFERLGAVRAEVAYTSWRRSLAAPAPVLSMIVEDVACSTVAKRFRRDKRTIQRILIDAIDAWPGHYDDARNRVDEATLLAAQAAIL